jgi:hypothetical protein
VPDVAGDADTQAGTPMVTAEGGKAATNSVGPSTSAAAALWGGLVALADQYAHHDLGFVNPTIYRIARGPTMTIAGRGSGDGWCGARAARGVGGALPWPRGARHRAGSAARPVGPSGAARRRQSRSRAAPVSGGCRCAGKVADDQAGTPLGGGLPGGLPARPAHRVTAMPAFGPQRAGVPGAQFPEGHPHRGRPPGPQVLQGMAQVPDGRYRQGYLVRARPRVSGHGPGQRGVRATTATVR